MSGTDFTAHNEEVREVWRTYHEGSPIRTPMVLGVNPRLVLLDPQLNRERVTFEQYFEDPAVMFHSQLRSAHYVRHTLRQDAEMGLPEQWGVYVDLQNSYEALWYGGEITYIEGNVPNVHAFVTDERKWAFIDAGPPDPFAGWLGRAWEYRHRMLELADGYEFHGRPVAVGGVPGGGTDGPFTAACELRGPTELCIDMYVDPDFYHALMGLIVEATIARIEAFRRRTGDPVESKAWGFADDSIQLLSIEEYREFVLPYHRRLIERFGPEGPNSIHLCGDATRHFRMLRDELRITTFDTGFPVDHGRLREELGPEVTIQGGPHVEFLRSSTPTAVEAETRRILASGVREGGRFILREGNNLAPGTPPANVEAMYEACRRYGRFD